MSAGTTYRCTPATTEQWCGWEWKSSATLLGLPLVHITWGRDSRRRLLRSHGIIAIGQFATGGLVIAQFGAGVIFIGQFGIGILALSQFALAFAAVAQITLSAYAIAQVALCLHGFGQHVYDLSRFLP